MRQVARKGLVTAMAAGGVLAATAGYAHADAGAEGGTFGSPGVGSGNNVQVPVHVPVNVCGNTVNVIGLLNPAVGNNCANVSRGHGTPRGKGGATAEGGAHGSPGVASGNSAQVPVDVPVNACGNSVNVIAGLNPTLGNNCANVSDGGPHNPGNPEEPEWPEEPETPEEPENPGNPEEPENPGNPGTPGNPETPASPGDPGDPVRPQTPTVPQEPVRSPQLAQTGAPGSLALVIPASAGLLLGGVALYRRFRPTGV